MTQVKYDADFAACCLQIAGCEIYFASANCLIPSALATPAP
jgi:hypothetical protein